MRILTLDGGSSSLKAAVYEMPSETMVFSHSAAGAPRDQAGLVASLLNLLESDGCAIDAVGHRIVFGGPQHVEPERVTPQLLEQLERLIAYDPLHLRSELEAVRAVEQAMPGTPQVLCYDTAFHQRMPEVAKRYPLPPEFGENVQRFGYHGLSYEYIVSRIGAHGRAVIAHLGSGASLAAVKDGAPVDTTMGFSPLGGLMMGTRPGDLDPGVLLYALSELGLSPERLRELLNERSGLLGVSGISSQMDVLVRRAPQNERAALAIDLFVYTVRKYIGAMAAALNGIDALVFTGGIGENSASVRARICDGLSYLGIRIDGGRNEQHAEVISPDAAGVTVRVLKTNEGLTIVRHAAAVLTTAV